MGMWMLALCAAAGLLVPWPSNDAPARPRTKTVGYSDFLRSLHKGQVEECTVGVEDLTFSLKGEATVFVTKQLTAPQHLIDSMFSKGVTFTQDANSPALRSEDKSSKSIEVINALLYGVTGLGLLWFGRQMEESKDSFKVGMQADQTVFDHSISFDDIAGIDESKAAIIEVVDMIKHPLKYSKIGARVPKGILLCGPPGTGKTLLARCIASEANLPFFFCSGSDFVEMFVGRGAARVRDLFERARRSPPSVVFVDELDAMGKQRGRGPGGNDEGEQTLNQLLTCLDGIDSKGGPSVLFIAATNRLDILDEALTRPGRFDRIITVGLPDETGRKAVLRVHTKNLSLDKDIDLDAIARATPNTSPAELASIANEAAITAVRRGAEKICQDDFNAAVLHHMLSRTPAGPDSGKMGSVHMQEIFEDMLARYIAFHPRGVNLQEISEEEETPRQQASPPRGYNSGVRQTPPIEEIIRQESPQRARGNVRQEREQSPPPPAYGTNWKSHFRTSGKGQGKGVDE